MQREAGGQQCGPSASGLGCSLGCFSTSWLPRLRPAILLKSVQRQPQAALQADAEQSLLLTSALTALAAAQQLGRHCD